MAINTDIWGTPETWQPEYTDYYAGFTDCYIPETPRETYYKNYQAGRIELDTIDKSICFWGIGKNSLWCNPQYLSVHADGSIDNPVITKTPVESTPNDKPLICMLGVPSGGTVGHAFSERYTPFGSVSMLNKKNYKQFAITSFNYQKLVICPYIRTVNSSNSGNIYKLKDYIDNYEARKNDYNRIVGISFSMYTGSAGSRNNAVYGGFLISTTFDVAGYSGTYDGKVFYASATGYSQFQTSSLYQQADNQIIFDINNIGNTTNTTPNATVGTAETGLRYRYCTETPPMPTSWGTASMPWYLCNDDIWTTALYRDNSWQTIAYIDINEHSADDVLNYIFKQIAFLGFPFIYDSADYNKAIGDVGVYLPVFDDNGVTTGDYVEGANALNLTNAEWVDGRDSGYDPNRPPTPESGDTGDLSNTGAPRNPTLFGELTFYSMTPSEYYNFVKALNSYYVGKTPDDWTLDFQGVNPSEYILNCYYTWFDLPTNDVELPINIGTITLPDVTSRKLQEGDTALRPNRWQYCDFGTRQISPVYYDFRDLSPYTEIELYLPLAGTLDLETAYIMGHNISIRYYYNLLTMTGVACVYRDDMLYKTADLQIASQIPLLSTNIGQYQNQIVSLENARKQNAIRLTAGAIATAAGVGATIATGGAALPALAAIGTGAAALTTGVINQDKLEYDISHTAPSLSVTGAAEATNNLCSGQLVPKLIIKRAAMLPHDDAIYARTVGNACCINTTVGAMSGLTVCSNADLSGITATAAEISAIQNLLTSGVYV